MELRRRLLKATQMLPWVNLILRVKLKCLDCHQKPAISGLFSAGFYGSLHFTDLNMKNITLKHLTTEKRMKIWQCNVHPCSFVRLNNTHNNPAVGVLPSPSAVRVELSSSRQRRGVRLSYAAAAAAWAEIAVLLRALLLFFFLLLT